MLVSNLLGEVNKNVEIGDDETPAAKEENPSNYLETINFAEEEIPTNLPQVESKLLRYMKKFSFSKTGSYDLHKKAEKHLPKISKILASYGIPDDFKYVPLLESGMNQSTTSHKGAGGYWQFMPQTARLYGLVVNGSRDDRKDFTKSTHAAARYIKDLYKQFGNWTLVAAAYNVGGGRLKSAIKRQNEDSYYELALNAETSSYVYKLISIKEIIENPDKHGYKRYAKHDVETENDPKMF
ncbi:lytic transglycosylase domain-containing protein [Rhinopithecimicrobium faecis]